NGGCSAGHEGSTVHGRSLEVRRNLGELRKAGRGTAGRGKASAQRTGAGGPAPHPDPGPNWTGQNRSSPPANASCARPAAPGSAWRVLYSKKKVLHRIPGKAARIRRKKYASSR